MWSNCAATDSTSASTDSLVGDVKALRELKRLAKSRQPVCVQINAGDSRALGVEESHTSSADARGRSGYQRGFS